MLVTSILGVFLLTPAILATPILGSLSADTFASANAVNGDAVATASAVGGTAVSSASASFSSSAVNNISPILPSQYGPVQTVPVLQNVQTIQQVPIFQNYQTIQHVPVGGDIGGFGLAGGAIGGAGFGGGLGRYRESYTIRSRGFGGGLGGFGHRIGGGRFKAHYSSGGLAAGGFGGFGVGAGLLG